MKTTAAQKMVLAMVANSGLSSMHVEGRAALSVPALETAGLLSVERVTSWEWTTLRNGTVRRSPVVALVCSLTPAGKAAL